MTWRQPIPTDLKDLTKGNEFCATLFAELLRRATNKSEGAEVQVGDYWIYLKRGQCTCGRFELARHFGLKRKEAQRVYRALKKLEEVHNLIEINKSKDCSIITIINYDELVDMKTSDEQSMIKQRTNNEQSMNTNKSVKSGKSVNSSSNNEDYEGYIKDVI